MKSHSAFSLLAIPLSIALSLWGCSDNQPTSTSSSGAGGENTGGSGGSAGSAGSSVGGAGGSASTSSGSTSTSSGSTSTSTSSSSSSSSGGGGGAPIGTPCTGGVGGCDPGLYCNAPGCGFGACAQKPPVGLQPQTYEPVCGCDGVTYWNADIATALGSSIKTGGICPIAEAVPCNPQSPCGPGLYCNRQVAAANQCSPQVTGTCWGVPIACALDGPKAKGCGDNMCYLQCSLIQSKNPWYNDGTCP